ncbi:LuxR C-terminal-related transcriptional regulator [Corynebacterium heidelbergense]|uniref:DNA-binding response regulator n=1 Tax=Corynebacterium heidelbergense TaxID=2055947 RepID=A0A364V446_9CORY|nr:response regulator transcription factor [Corynebacterium heidelbergense]RAV31386.1 DNA-binding response regulator [Corynebacterium heidelbergense]
MVSNSAAAQPARGGGGVINVLIADDHPVVRAGLQAVLTSVPGSEDIRVVGLVESPEEAVRQVTRLAESSERVDVVLMDLRFGQSPSNAAGAGAGGVQATQRLRALADPPQVLVVTNYSSDGEVVGAVSAGAVGYLLKDCPPEDLVSGIHKAARGEAVMSQQVMGKLMGRLNNPAEALTPREMDVLRLVGDGRSNREIARTLVLTEATIKSHLGHIFTKLGVSNRTGAVATARERGIL